MCPYARIEIPDGNVGDSPLTTSVKMVGAAKLLANSTSMKFSNLSEYLIFGVADCLLLPTLGLQIASVGGAVLVALVQMEILVPVLSL